MTWHGTWMMMWHGTWMMMWHDTSSRGVNLADMEQHVDVDMG
jgi:hypothetical protein